MSITNAFAQPQMGVMTPGGGTTGAPLQMGQMPMNGQNPGYQLPGQPQMGGQMGGGPHNDAFHQSILDWRGQRPDHVQGMDPAAFQQQMMDWHNLRPEHRAWLQSIANPPQNALGNTGIVPPGMLPPMQAPPQASIAPQGGYGSQLGVIGATQANSPYGLPSY